MHLAANLACLAISYCIKVLHQTQFENRW